MQLVPNYVVDTAKAKYHQIATARTAGENTLELELELSNILIHATLAGTPKKDLYEIATICASCVFLPGEQS